ncbi:IDEAL domain-containing protein [Salimicrobium halophilum]|uniref:IDEAL domain-containing protein n=1 Tax=Salimicrobium halophilum TaxID=86666 RepID=A0A1G8TLP5_9BACI|nr:IDEAL domain-containing protein [Salimicrobium halophilum]SDJ42438.1 IDEAL domain-containing protein [Salimicrobium halophilum]
MRKQKSVYVLRRFPSYRGRTITAKRELSYGIKLASRLFLDQMMYEFNKSRLDAAINEAIDNEDREAFEKLSVHYQPYTWE